MTQREGSVIFLPGAGGGIPDLNLFREDPSERVEIIEYPGWQSYVRDGFSGEAFIADLAAKVTERAGNGPIHILGNSIGGHFGYAVAIHLQRNGRDIAGFCAIDSRHTSPDPSSGWKKRALAEALELIRARRVRDFALFLRSRFWRACLRLAPNLISKIAAVGGTPRVSAIDPIFAKELDMRFLLRETASFLAKLDDDPAPLHAPAILLRTHTSAVDDAVWKRRCPNLLVLEIPGHHESIFEPENIGTLRRTYLAATHGWRHAPHDIRISASTR